MKGIVTVYSIAGCPHCLQAKRTLQEKELAFQEVLLDAYPHVRDWLREKTGKSGVPQIFFNEAFIGGNDALQSATKNEDEWQKLLLELENNPSKGELLIPSPSDAPEKEGGGFTCEVDSIGLIVEEFSNSGIPRPIRVKWFSGLSDKTFSGSDFIAWHSKIKAVDNESSINVGSELLAKRFFIPVGGDYFEKMVDDVKTFYRVNEIEDTSALNAGKTRNCKIDSASKFAGHLQKIMLQLYSECLSEDGKLVDYERMKNLDKFSRYKELAKELQRVPVESLSEDEKKAFFINVYNALVIHANADSVFASGPIDLSRFYSGVKYIIGGHVCSLDDIEHGILRANSRPVSNFFPLFGRDDPRKKLSLSQVDPRIHFALNCGAKSCPPIKSFTAEKINEELNLATSAYLETEEGVKIECKDGQKSIVHLSSLLKWYSADFGGRPKNVLTWIAKNIGNSEKEKLVNKVLAADSFKVVYMDYNWDKNVL